MPSGDVAGRPGLGRGKTVCRRRRPTAEDGRHVATPPTVPLRSRVALVTGVGRRRSIGAELALGLAADGLGPRPRPLAALRRTPRLRARRGRPGRRRRGVPRARQPRRAAARRPRRPVDAGRARRGRRPSGSARSRASSCRTASRSTAGSSRPRSRAGTGTTPSTPGRRGCSSARSPSGSRCRHRADRPRPASWP